jgi:hypothetical protein
MKLSHLLLLLVAVALLSVSFLGRAAAGPFSSWVQGLRSEPIMFQGRRSPFSRDRWTDEVFVVRWQGSDLGRHGVRYPLVGVKGKKFEVQEIEVTSPEGPKKLFVGVSHEKDFIEEYALPKKITEAPILTLVKYGSTQILLITKELIYVRDSRKLRYETVPIVPSEHRLIPSEEQWIGHDFYIADNNQVFYVNPHGELRRVETKKPKMFRAAQRFIGFNVLCKDDETYFFEGKALSREEAAGLEKSFSRAEIETSASSSSIVSAHQVVGSLLSSADDAGLSSAGIKASASKLAPLGALIQLESGAHVDIDGKLRVTLLEIARKFQQRKNENVSSPASTATRVSLKVELSGKAETLDLQFAEAGFLDTRERRWQDYRIELLSIDYFKPDGVVTLRVSAGPGTDSRSDP